MIPEFLIILLVIGLAMSQSVSVLAGAFRNGVIRKRSVIFQKDNDPLPFWGYVVIHTLAMVFYLFVGAMALVSLIKGHFGNLLGV